MQPTRDQQIESIRNTLSMVVLVLLVAVWCDYDMAISQAVRHQACRVVDYYHVKIEGCSDKVRPETD